MTWLCLLLLLVVAMTAVEAAGAERNFRRSREPSPLGRADHAPLDDLLSDRRR
ncbi:MAG TPA: hypothetical protein VEZ70_02220 [Allosphingosinicella sp.]|nr:hypothetical protein [Allosphingosinicella sp.]